MCNSSGIRLENAVDVNWAVNTSNSAIQIFLI